ncbi:MAG TPA: serine/threonine-protein kinase, partial [Gemmataceae bacterium]|nr:serine/threonine-protein kinase [Gemmataceae bacterium]
EPLAPPGPQPGNGVAELIAGHPDSSSARSSVIDYLYDEFFRRRESGEELEVAAFCEQFPSLKDSLALAIWTHLAAEEAAKDLVPRQEPPWPPPGAVIRSFFLKHKLGQGSFACVYRAEDGTLGCRQVVIKLFQGDVTEAHTLGRLNHPNIIPVHSVFEDESTGFKGICMPYLGRATLADVIERAFAGGRRPARASAILDAAQDPEVPNGSAPACRLLHRGSYLEGVVWLAAQIADALAYIHAQGFCHRDVKPTNVLVTPAGQPVLLDFNLSATGPVNPLRVGGTVGYMAPEQLAAYAAKTRGAYPAPNPATDIYSLGVLLYELLTGHHPFGPLNVKLPWHEQAYHVRERQQQGFRPLTRRGDEVEPWLAHLVERCLAYDVRERTITAAEMAAVLHRGVSWRQRLRRRLLSRTGLATAVPLVSLAVFMAGTGARWAASQGTQHELVLGRTAYQQGHYPDAVTHLSRVIEANPRLARPLFLRGRAYQKMGLLDEAIRDYEAANELAPDGRVDAALGYCFTVLKRYRQAPAHYQAAIRHGFGTAVVYNDLGHVLWQLGQCQEAARSLDQAIAIDNHLQSAYYNRAKIALSVRGRTSVPLEQGVADMREAIHLGPATARLYLDAARLHGFLMPTQPQHKIAVLHCLQRALQLGLDPGYLKRDWVFFPLRRDPDFEALEAKPSSKTKAPEPTLLLDPITDQAGQGPG